MFKKNVKSAVALLMAVLMLISLAACGNGGVSKKTVDLSSYINVEFTGLNGNVKASVSIDYSGIESALYSAGATTDENGLGVGDYIDYTLDKSTKLSNGDKILVTLTTMDESIDIYDLQDSMGVSFNTTYEFEVSGLAEGTPIDVFGTVDQHIVYSGSNGNGRATVVLPEDYSYETNGYYFKKGYKDNEVIVVSDNQEIAKLEYSMKTRSADEEEELLSAGTVYELCVYQYDYDGRSYTEDDDGYCYLPIDEELANKGLYVGAKFKNITTPDLGSYVTDKSKLTQADIDNFKNIITNDIYERLGPDYSVVFGDFYFGKIKPTATAEEGSKNILVATYMYSTTTILGSVVETYTTTTYDSLIIKNGASLSYNLANAYRCETFLVTESFEELEQELYLNNNYTFEKIG